MAKYIDITFASGASDEAHCEIVTARVRLLGMTIDLGDDKRPDKLVAAYEAEEGGIMVYDVEQTEEHIRARLRRYGSLEAVRRDYSAYLERLEII
jgi:hypothetical protein